MTTHPPAPKTPPAGAGAAPAPAARLPQPGLRRLSSSELLGGRTEVEIEHEAQVYRLRRTAMGKLILTK
ncbi:hemin uptake protein HemP [Rubrivivax sp. RP6-9]|uniref:hemin uptake protein HemP n=1 Tax=Rubrivivax sp. RP6-9 TaxID=3415750 RepID=UPI003CC578C6